MRYILLILIYTAQLFSLNDGFDFGTSCEGGSGTFEQQIQQYNGDYENAVTVGEIPSGIEGLKISLTSDKDVDIRLYAGSDKIVHWPYGLLNKAQNESVVYEGTEIVYSGYNGVDGHKGHEYIEVKGVTPKNMTMKAFGYRAGFATVDYSWSAKKGCTNGEGNFTQSLEKDAISVVGEIPIDIKNLHVALTSETDLDIQLYGDDGTAIIAWPDGLLNGARLQSIDYHNMNIVWSGYNGDGSGKGHEYIDITGATTEHLTMKVFGYESGFADVVYTWDTNSTDTNTTDTNMTTIGSSGNYMLAAWNDLGMHCMDGNDFSVFSVLPPYNNLHAQLKDKNGNLITAGVTLTYESAQGTDGKWNTSSTDKTNFWQYSKKLLGATLAVDTGLTGQKTPSKIAQPMHYNTVHKWWEAEGIPLTPYNDDGSKNYYPLVKVVARDSTGTVLADATTVLPVSDEMDCKRCHASNGTTVATKPKSGWVNHSNLEKDYKFNILRLHDDKQPNAVKDNSVALHAKGYNYDVKGLEATALSGIPIQCAACHKSNALPGVGIGLKSFTSAIHGKHANVIDPLNGLSLNDISNRNACYVCHPGAETKCLRGAMGDAKNSDGISQMQCQSCHGNMQAVGNSQREGWFDEPNCQACHHDGKQETSAIDPVTHTLRNVIDTRFATNPNTPVAGVSLYRFSTGHGNLQCEACHGATHAIYPAHNADNILSKGIQGHSGALGECKSCHTKVPNTHTGGPHGMHPVGQAWVEDHEDVAEHNPTQCKVCHGQDYRGSVLSKMWKTRTLNIENGSKTLNKGHQVSCYDCHNGPKGGDGD